MNNMQIPKLNIKYPHKTGLLNPGQKCFMNATIQCLSNIRDLTDYLLGNLGKLNVNKQPLTTQYTNLLSGLFYTKEKYIDPFLFRKVIEELNPLFQGSAPGDSKDLLFYILEAIHNELTPEQKNVKIAKKNFFQLELESKDEKKMLQNFFDDFNSKNKTKIYDIFYGITRSTMKCNNCRITKYSFQLFNMLIFQLKKIKDDKMAELGEFYNNNEKLNILDAFLNQQKEEKLFQENMIYCNNCKGLHNGVHQQVIYGLPKVLIIILNRGRDNLDFNEEFLFPDILDLKDKGIVLLNQSSYHKYYLCGILTHFGDSGNQGHFAAYCRNSSTDTFTFYNDTAVTQSISIESAMKTVISDDSCKKKTPYILFYNSFE
jgi:ubiquitin C-terminal hydrolase